MIDKEAALEIAHVQFLKHRKSDKYQLLGAEYFEERKGKYPAKARWLVHYQKPQPADGSVIEDGDQLFVVEIDPESGRPKVLNPI